MPLAQPIAALRQELNKLLADDDLPAGLKLCKELLPENSEKFKLILAMQANIGKGNFDPLLEITGRGTELNLDDFKDILLPNEKSTGKGETKKGAKPSPGPPKRLEPSDPFYKGMTLVKVGVLRKNSFFSKDDEESKEELSNHSKSGNFYLIKSPVTYAQWRAVMGNNAAGYEGCEECLVENVSREDIQAFLIMLNAQTGRQYRLPTEAEWKLAVKAGYRKGLGLWLVL